MRPIDYGDLSDVSEAGWVNAYELNMYVKMDCLHCSDSSDDDNGISLDGFQFIDPEDENKHQHYFKYLRDRSYERYKYF